MSAICPGARRRLYALADAPPDGFPRALGQMSVSCPGDWTDTVRMSKARARGKRYETALRVGSLANLALVSARSPRAVEEARPQAPAPGPVRVADGQGGQWLWSNS